MWVPLIISVINLALFEFGINLRALQEEESAHVAELMKGVPYARLPSMGAGAAAGGHAHAH